MCLGLAMGLVLDDREGADMKPVISEPRWLRSREMSSVSVVSHPPAESRGPQCSSGTESHVTEGEEGNCGWETECHGLSHRNAGVNS